eukprot:gene21772-27837_t
MHEPFDLWEYNRGWDNSGGIMSPSSSAILHRDNRSVENGESRMHTSSSFVHLSGNNTNNDSSSSSSQRQGSSSINALAEQVAPSPVSKTELLQKAELMIREWKSVYSESQVHRDKHSSFDNT